MLRVAHASRPALAAPRRARAPRRAPAPVAAAPRQRAEPPLQRLALSLRAIAAPAVRASTPQKVLVTSLGASAALALLRWRAVLSAIVSPALALAAVGWVLAHESRAALEEDFLVLFHPERPRRALPPVDAFDVSGVVDIDIDIDDDEEEEEEPAEGPWDGGFKPQRASVLDAQRPDLLPGVGGDGPKAWSHGPPPS